MKATPKSHKIDEAVSTLIDADTLRWKSALVDLDARAQITPSATAKSPHACKKSIAKSYSCERQVRARMMSNNVSGDAVAQTPEIRHANAFTVCTVRKICYLCIIPTMPLRATLP